MRHCLETASFFVPPVRGDRLAGRQRVAPPVELSTHHLAEYHPGTKTMGDKLRLPNLELFRGTNRDLTHLHERKVMN